MPPSGYRLAPELLRLVFRLCLEKRNEHYTEIASNQAPLNLIRVCRAWRVLAFDTAELWDAFSIRRRVRPPYGYDFHKDSEILRELFAFAKARPTSVQLAYGNIMRYGNHLMWSALITLSMSFLRPEARCERLYLRFPDDCMEKFLWKACTEGISHPSLRSLTLHSTREDLLQKRYAAWWNEDQDAVHFPHYCHELDITGLPALEELGIHFPGPIRLSFPSMSVKKLCISLYKWNQLELLTNACPNLEHLTLEMQNNVQDGLWETLDGELLFTIPNVRTLEVRSAVSEAGGGLALMQLFLRLHIPELKTLRLRRLHRTRLPKPSVFILLRLICKKGVDLEELEVIDLPPEPDVAEDIAAMLEHLPKLRRFSYRDLRTNGSAQHFAQHLLAALTWGRTEFASAACLEELVLDTPDMRTGGYSAVPGLLQLVASRRMADVDAAGTADAMVTDAPEKPTRLRELRLPWGYREVLRGADEFGVCDGLQFGLVEEIAGLEPDDDLDDGDDSIFGWKRIEKQRVPYPEDSASSLTLGPVAHRSLHRSMHGGMLDEASLLEVERLVFGGLDGSGTFGPASQGSFGNYDGGSLAEVEQML